MALAELDDLDVPPPLTDAEAHDLVAQAIPGARTYRARRACIVEIVGVSEITGASLTFAGATWEQAIDHALTAHGR